MKVGASDHLSFDGRRLMLPASLSVSETSSDGDVTVASVGAADPLAAALGFANWNYNIAATQAGSVTVSQTIYATGIFLPFGVTVGNVHLLVKTAGSGTAPTGFFVGIASASKMLAQSGNLNASAGLTTQGRQAFALSASYTPSASDSANGFFYVVFLQNGAFGTTNVQFGLGANVSGLGTVIGSSPPLSASLGLSQTALPANGAAVTPTAQTPGWWVGASA